ncbi:Dihydrolipoyllysine-residue succinyltransferase component of 2-oxoglutarate dehydrogenase complex [Buchnera aphidicola (Eriosoma grossulariae)]|uniref:dihydrolipoyllysine-residue succinyltransferase n=1 Tax=Buchnera aphidicola TaxID=9 RepID=UPI0034649D91
MKKINILVPELPDSINDATVASWHKKKGDLIKINELIVDIETDKIMLEVVSPTNGILCEILETEGKIVKARQILGYINKSQVIHHEKIKKNKVDFIDHNNHSLINAFITKNTILNDSTPKVRRLTNNHNFNSINIKNRIEEKERIIQQNSNNFVTQNHEDDLNNIVLKNNNDNTILNIRKTKTIPMSRLRQKISERLLETKQKTAMLTTFNEVNMQSIIKLRKKYGVIFKNNYQIRLGFMSFYVKVVIEALKRHPEINATIKDQNIIYYQYYDINIAISTPRGLITPILKNADLMSMYVIEKKIEDYVFKSQTGKISLEELTGGTFTITNGGVFGSMMSTPIINPPQTAILGIHAIKDRPMAVNNEVKILPMMYLALSYDHRLIDGKSAVQFLVTIKHLLEDFSRILLEI